VQGLLKYSLLLTLTFLSANAVGYGADYADFFINSYSKSWTEKWMDDDLARRKREQAKSASGDNAEVANDAEDESEKDELFGPDMLNTYHAGLRADGTYGYQEDWGIWNLSKHFSEDMGNISYAHSVKLLEPFNDNAKKLWNIPKYNLASGLTVLLAGGYAAYNNRPFPKEAIRLTVEQIREVLHADAGFNGMKGDYKRAMYQEAVVMGLQLQLAQAQIAKNPDPVALAKMQQIGAKILRERLGVEPQRIHFTEKGIVIR